LASAQDPGQRRLGAIMFTDIVGYSAITSTDEGRALKLLEEHRGLLGGVFDRHAGVVVKTMGDGFLVEFASAVEAVNCAVEAQQELRRFNEGRREKAMIRIGIHVGDVVHSGGDIFGDAVNVAARLQPLAETGGICITRQVVDQIERKVDYRMVKIGTRELKNIRYPVELYRVEVPSGAGQGGPELLDPKRLAILPLANLSSDPNDKYFADGMTEELISTVSRISDLSVISRTSVMRYKDTTTPIGEIGRELSAGTVLEGSVRKAGNKVRITTQLIDAQNDKHLWAQSYDRDMTDIFAIQADIAEKVAEALRVRLVPSQKAAMEKKPTSNPDAFTLYLKGRYYWNERSYEDVEKSLRYFGDALDKDPGFALGHSGMADAYLIQIDRAWLPYDQTIPKALEHARKSVELDPDLAEGHASLGLAYEMMWDFKGAEEELKRAIELRPGYATAYHWYAILESNLGRNQDALGIEMKALELDPQSSIVRQGVGNALASLGRFEEALAQFRSLVEADPEFGSAHYWKAWCHYSLGAVEEAVSEMKKASQTSKGGLYISDLGLACILLRAGRKEEALSVIKKADEDSASLYKSPALQSMVKFDLGDVDSGYDLLDRAVRERDNFLFYFKGFPWYAQYREHPRWKAIEEKLGIPSKA
jgi:adenylate cyclase